MITLYEHINMIDNSDPAGRYRSFVDVHSCVFFEQQETIAVMLAKDNTIHIYRKGALKLYLLERDILQLININKFEDPLCYLLLLRLVNNQKIGRITK